MSSPWKQITYLYWTGHDDAFLHDTPLNRAGDSMKAVSFQGKLSLHICSTVIWSWCHLNCQGSILQNLAVCSLDVYLEVGIEQISFGWLCTRMKGMRSWCHCLASITSLCIMTGSDVDLLWVTASQGIWKTDLDRDAALLLIHSCCCIAHPIWT